MTNEPHLILHKVRNEPAFDIAEPMEVDNEVIWIIPTSGHRAYPYWNMPMKIIMCFEGGNEALVMTSFVTQIAPAMPTNIPDHYSANASPKPSTFSPTSLLTRLGLLPKINRRF